ncbi:MAG: alpha/beta fold hydrolase [Planctomycetes bacterium]|nr:alpha/beta fold hydrolase [Planctomycetota bacterium]
MTHARPILCLLATLALTSCVLWRYGDDIDKVEALGSVSGTVRGADGPIVVALYRQQQDGRYSAETLWVREGEGAYDFPAAPGPVYLFAFADDNRDLTYQQGERLGWHGAPSLLEIEPAMHYVHLDIRLRDPEEVDEVLPWMLEDRTKFDPIDPAATHIGEVVTMDDPRFEPAVGDAGMWEPYRFVEEDREGLFLLEPYSPDKTPVLFVHGMRSAGGDWRTVIDGLDRARYQPWILQYPSGFDLATIGLYAHQALLQMRVKHGYERLVIVAHSMGGLIARNVVSRSQKQDGDLPIRALVTISTPWGGHWGANIGVAIAPTVVPVWRDMVPKSPFLTTLWRDPLPEGLRFSMLFSYRGDDDDGVISFESQLPLHVQLQADRVLGLHEDHHSILKSEALVRLLHDLIAP